MNENYELKRRIEYDGVIETVKAPIYDRDVPQVMHDLAKKHQVVVSAYATLIGLISGDKPVYMKVNSGAREGSIVRVNGRALASKLTRPGVRTSELKRKELINGALVTHESGWNQRDEIRIRFPIYFDSNDRLKVDFDDRKSVTLDYSAMASVTFLPYYNGPTVFAFSKTMRSDEEKAQAKLKQHHKVLDRLGHEIKLGDLFLYASSEELYLGKLVKVGATGALAYTPYDSKDTRRLMGGAMMEAIKKGKHCPNLLLFDAKLGDRFMMAKLSKD